jgi:hypothetical protein
MKVINSLPPAISLVLFGIILLTGCVDNSPKTVEDIGIFKLVKEGRIAWNGGKSRGVAWGDYDGDGDPDLYVANANGQWNSFFRNNSNGNFQKITAAKNKASETVIYGGNSQGVNWVDYDNDGDLDLYIVSRGEEANFLFRNDSLTTFTRITDSPLTADSISASMACWADFDKDGDLDVFLAGYNHPNMAFRNTGSGQFEIVENTALTINREGRARACGCGDVNNDGLPELYVGNARRTNLYFQNLGDWQFVSMQVGHLVNDIGYSYGVSWADYDDDGDMDLFVANFDKENFLYNNDGVGNLTPITEGSIAIEKGGASKGHAWGDYDNDGDLDLYVANGTYAPNMHNFLYLNSGDGSFERDMRGDLIVQADTSAGAAHADYDRDGDLDLFVANWGGRDQINRLYENTTTKGNWISVRLVGDSSNHFGVGTRVVTYVSDDQADKTLSRWMYPTTGYASQNDYELHFGLGNLSKIDSLHIYWPSGIIDTHHDIQVNTHWLAQEKGTLSITN